jgi:NAD(P)-dependent dehydrogenase (short-subunit alcohol dehydrogenase family)
MPPKTFLVTGSSSGLGLSFVRYVLSQGHNVIATSRNPSRTPDLVDEIEKSPKGRWLKLDVTAPQATITDTIQSAAKLFGPIDVLVNNAGYSVMGAIEDMDEEKARVQFDTNYWGAMRCIKAVLPSMRGRKSGVIVNVSSIGGLQALATSGVYGASKFALEGKPLAVNVDFDWTCHADRSVRQQ